MECVPTLDTWAVFPTTMLQTQLRKFIRCSGFQGLEAGSLRPRPGNNFGISAREEE